MAWDRRVRYTCERSAAVYFKHPEKEIYNMIITEQALHFWKLSVVITALNSCEDYTTALPCHSNFVVNTNIASNSPRVKHDEAILDASLTETYRPSGLSLEQNPLDLMRGLLRKF